MSIEGVRIEIADHAEQIKRLFRQECNPRVSIIVQNDSTDEVEGSVDMLVTESADIDDVIESLNRLKGVSA